MTSVSKFTLRVQFSSVQFSSVQFIHFKFHYMRENVEYFFKNFFLYNLKFDQDNQALNSKQFNNIFHSYNMTFTKRWMTRLQNRYISLILTVFPKVQFIHSRKSSFMHYP